MLPLTLNLDCKIDKRDYLTIMQGYTYKVEVNMFDNDSPLDLTNAVINIDFMKADKKFIIQTKDITIGGNKVSFNTDSDFSNISGKAKIQIIVKKDGFIYGSWVVDTVIKPSAINDNDGQSENKLTITQDLKDTIAKAESDIVAIPIEAEKKINELTSQANTSIETLKTNTQKTITDLTNQANTSINNVSSNADTKINVLITKSNQTIANLEQAIANGDIEALSHEVFDKEYSTFTTNKSIANVGESEISGLMTLEEPMLEETTEDESGIMTLEEPMIHANTTITPIKTGIPKSATLKGQTLVNHLLKCKSNVTSASNVIEFALPMNVAKKYILKFRINSLPTLNESDYRAVKFEWYTGGTTGGYYNHFKQNVTIGKDEYVIIPPYTGEVTRTNFSIWSPSYESGTLDIDVAIFEYQDGMENWDIPYFTGMASVVNPSVTSVGKNLFSNDYEVFGTNAKLLVKFENGFKTTGFVSDAQAPYQVYNVVSGQSYVFNCDVPTKNGYVQIKDYYDNSELATIYGSNLDALHCKFKAKSNKIQVRLFGHLSSLNIAEVQMINIQLEQGTVATTCEPYKSNILSTSSEVVLRSLPNGVRDTLNVKTGEYVQRIGEVTLNGSENWELNNTSNSELITFGISSFPSDILVHDFNDKTITITSTLLRQVDYLNNECYLTYNLMGNRWTVITVKRSKLATEDLTGFKDWLSKNQVIMQYQLATPVIKTVDLTGVPFFYEDGHILLSADSILPTLEYTVATTLKGQGENTAEELLDVKLNKLDKTEKASDSALLNGVKEDTSATGNTIVKRDSYGGAKFKNLTMNNNNSLYGTTTGGGTVNLAYLSNTNKAVYGAITNGMLLRSNTQPMLNINGTEKAIYSEHNLKIETGNFTPYIYGAKTNGNLTHSVQKGRYVKIGEMIYCHINVRVESGHGSLAGDVRIGGIPFIQNEDAVNSSVAIGYYRGIGSGKFQITACLLAWENFIRLYVCDASNTDWFAFLNDANLTDTGRIEFTLSFMMRTV